MILTHYQAKQLLEAKKKGQKDLDVSLDLDFLKTKADVKIEKDIFIFPDGQYLDEKQLKKIIKNDTTCFLISDNSILKIQLFSEQTRKFYKLVPTKDAPTIEISGIRMHVTKDLTPLEDTRKKIESISPIKGNVLDTCMGLGYTAIMSSKYADSVITCEKDENVIEIAKLNPWSKELFENKKISILKADIFEEIKFFKNEMFDVVIHDPPRLNLASLLYSFQFYKQLHRIMKKDGKLYHYTGNPGSKFRKIDLARNVGERLRKAGFMDLKKSTMV